MLTTGARMIREALALRLAQLKHTDVVVDKMERDGSAAGTLLITHAVYDKRLRRDAPVFMTTGDASLVGKVAGVRGKTALIDFIASASVLERVVACWDAPPTA